MARHAGKPKGFFLQVEDFGAAYARMASAGVQFLTTPRTEPYGQIAVFLDVADNKWDLIGPASLGRAHPKGRDHRNALRATSAFNGAKDSSRSRLGGGGRGP